MNEFEAAALIADHNGAGHWDAPAIPDETTWRKLALARLVKRLNPHTALPGCITAFLAVAETMAKHPAWQSEADGAATALEREWMEAEIAATERERDSIKPEQWKLSAAQATRARQVAGLAPRPQGDSAAFDVARHKAALELETGEIALDGYVSDVRRLNTLDARLSELQAKLKSLSTASERESAARAEKIKQAAAERKALSKAEPVTV